MHKDEVEKHIAVVTKDNWFLGQSGINHLNVWIFMGKTVNSSLKFWDASFWTAVSDSKCYQIRQQKETGKIVYLLIQI